MIRMVNILRPGEIANPRLAVLFKQMNAFSLDTDYEKAYLLGKVYEAQTLLGDKKASYTGTRLFFLPLRLNI